MTSGDLSNTGPGSVPLIVRDATSAPAITSAPIEQADRFASARTLEPQGRDVHNVKAWREGRDAAIAAMEGGTSAVKSALISSSASAACEDCWRRGRNAAAAAMMKEEARRGYANGHA